MAVLNLYKRGFSLSSGRSAGRVGGGRRGKLTGRYSSASFRRLREYVITHNSQGECWGITLTVPGLDNLSVDDFKRLHHSFCSWLLKRRYALIWRVELQRRGMPHLHCVFFGSVGDCFAIFEEWYRLLESEFVWSVIQVAKNKSELVNIPRSWVDGSRFACNLVGLDGGFSAFRYLVAHMSKGKIEQLGWAGRNWGVVCRRKFVEADYHSLELNDSEYYRLLRWVRRWTRRRVFGRSGCAFWVSNPDVVQRMIAFVLEY